MEHGPREFRNGLELSALDDDLAAFWFPYADSFLKPAFHQAHGLGYALVPDMPRSASSRRENPRECLEYDAFGVTEIGRVDEGEVEAVLPLVAVAVQVTDGVASGVGQ